MKSIHIKRAFLIFALFALFGQDAGAQVNTEAMRNSGLKEGFHTLVDFDFILVEGNSKLTRLKSSIRFDQINESSHTFIIGSYQRGRQGEDNKLFINKGFVHLRRTMQMNTKYSFEAFLQKEFNDFINLEDRNLIGGSLRINRASRAKDKNIGLDFYFGFGAMWEQEKISDAITSDENIFRSTNYFVIRWQPDEKILLQSTSYYQVDATNFGDYRILSNSGMNVTLTEKLSIALKLISRFDSEPPTGIENFDVEITNGISYMF